MRARLGTLHVPVNHERVSVPRSAHRACPKCGEIVLDRAETRLLWARAVDSYRRRYRLLGADDIRAIRERHQLTQAELAGLLRLGGNTLSRWESGRNVQTAAMDVLLRLVRDVPESLSYLRRRGD